MALYIECLSRLGLAVGTVKNHVTAIRLVHKLKNFQPPDLTDLDMSLCMRGVLAPGSLENLALISRLPELFQCSPN